jgi:hypothetical protein
MYLIGDIHGRFVEYFEVIKDLEESIQLGDFGLGFGNRNFGDDYYKEEVKKYPNHKFIRGNHDNPQVCNSMPNCLGDFGYIEKLDLFYVAGAYSIDRHIRIEGVDWWKEEELDYATFQKVVDLYEQVKPSIVISHDCPMDVIPYMSGKPIRNSTSSNLNYLFYKHQPKKWYFGHHHLSKDLLIEKTNFICLDIFEIKKIS